MTSLRLPRFKVTQLLDHHPHLPFVSQRIQDVSRHAVPRASPEQSRTCDQRSSLGLGLPHCAPPTSVVPSHLHGQLGCSQPEFLCPPHPWPEHPGERTLMALDSQELFSGTLVDAVEGLLLPLGSPPFLPGPLSRMLPSDLAPASVPQSVAGKKRLFLMSGPF